MEGGGSGTLWTPCICFGVWNCMLPWWWSLEMLRTTIERFNRYIYGCYFASRKLFFIFCVCLKSSSYLTMVFSCHLRTNGVTVFSSRLWEFFGLLCSCFIFILHSFSGFLLFVAAENGWNDSHLFFFLYTCFLYGSFQSVKPVQHQTMRM